MRFWKAARNMVKRHGSPVRTRRIEAAVIHSEPALSTRDIGRRAASGAALLTAKGTLAQVLGLLSTIVVTRLLLPNQLGLYAIAVTISTFLLMLGSGVGMAGCAHPAPSRARARRPSGICRSPAHCQQRPGRSRHSGDATLRTRRTAHGRDGRERSHHRFRRCRSRRPRAPAPLQANRDRRDRRAWWSITPGPS